MNKIHREIDALSLSQVGFKTAPFGQHQLREGLRHLSTMFMRLLTCALLTCVLGGLAGCTSNQNPDEIRRKTAEETATLKRDTKAVAEGVKQGLTSKNSVDLNHASKTDVSSLPGVTDRDAERIIAERPYANTHQLVTRHVLTEDEYARIQDRVIAGK